MGVLEKTLERCRAAVLGGVPILYVKTDSDVFIRKLVLSQERPFLVLLGTGGEDQGVDAADRPLREARNPALRRLELCKNHAFGLPERNGGGLYAQMTTFADGVAADMPFLWTCKMPSGEARTDPEMLRRLEQYVVDHEDPSHPQHDALQASVVLLYSSDARLTPTLMTFTEVIDVGYPDEEEIREIIKQQADGDRAILENGDYLSALCTDFLGFTSEEIALTMRRIQATGSLDDSARVEGLIADRKRQKMEGGILEQAEANGRLGGMRRFREWLDAQKDPLRNSNAYMRSIGTPPPKGVLLCGIPGCGKSEAARAAARTLELPLLKMDIGSLMDKYQGVSEQKMRDALSLAEAMTPCVLWIDELDKGFSSVGTDNDTGSAARMFAYMLGWMQDNRKPCFIFATANDIGSLPKEFFRSGRFDALYAVYLPTALECAEILRECMLRAEEAAARATGRDHAELFEEKCMSSQLLEGVVNEDLVREDGSPRIVVGSDLQQVASMALRSLRNQAEGPIGHEQWREALRRVISGSAFRAYGDGEENVDSIAIGYCRMLRKGIPSTADAVLFQSADYHSENAREYDELKARPARDMSSRERKEHEERIKALEILQAECPPSFRSRYDRAVHACLRRRINELAPALERRERERMLVR